MVLIVMNLIHYMFSSLAPHPRLGVLSSVRFCSRVFVRVVKDFGQSLSCMVMAAGLVDDSGSPLLESLLEQPCSEQHLVLISTLIADWRAVAPYLELTQADEAAILVFSPHSLPGQTLTMLRTWCQRNGAAATYKRLSDALSHCGRQDLVDKIHELATTHRDGAREEVSRRSGEGWFVSIDDNYIVLYMYSN